MTARITGALLTGSVALGSREEVMSSAARLLGPSLPRISDGELFEDGTHRSYTLWQRFHVENDALFEDDPDEAQHGGRITRGTETARMRLPPRRRLRAGIADADIRFGPTRHAEHAISAYGLLSRLKSEGVVRPETRLQVTFLTTAAFLNAHVVAADHARVEGPYRAALFAEVARIAEAVPHGELCIQWDVSTEMAQLEGVRDAYFAQGFEAVRDGVVARLARHCDAVPEGVELGLHLCYGNAGHRHWMEPADTGKMVDLFNRLRRAAHRRIDYVHMPVPIARDDEAYFAPLAGLERDPGTTLYLGLLHWADGVEGANRRIAAAGRFVDAFGVASECGLGSRTPDETRTMLHLTAEVAGGATAPT